MSTRLESSDKIYNIQLFRGLAIIAVVLIHTRPGGISDIIYRPFINYCVALFLFLSGYLTTIKNIDYIAFFKKRILRVIIPYLIWSLAYSIATKTTDRILMNILTTQSEGILYYIFVYIQFVLLTPLIHLIANTRFRMAPFMISPLSVLCFNYIPLFFGIQLNPILINVYNTSYLGWFSFFYMGFLLQNGYINITKQFKNLFVMYLLSILPQFAETFIWYKFGSADCGISFKITTLLTNSLFCMVAYKYIDNKYDFWNNKFIVTLGNCSFGIYLSHVMIIHVLNKIPFYSKIPYFFNTFLVLITSLLCVMIGRKICGNKISRWLRLL